MTPQVSNSSFTNYYDVLHLPRDATRAQIRQRYKKLSLLFHPDKNKDEDAPRIFRSLKNAEEILDDANRKATFDRQLNDIDNFLKGGSARAAGATAARAAAERDAENRARDQRHRERDRARAQQNNPQAEQSNSRPKPSGPNFHEHPEPKFNQPKPPRPPRPREDIYLPPRYKPSGRQPPGLFPAESQTTMHSCLGQRNHSQLAARIPSTCVPGQERQYPPMVTAH